MSQLTLTEEQSQQLYQMLGPIEILDAKGHLVVRFDIDMCPALIVEMKRAAREGPWLTSQQVLGHLAALEKEWERTGGFDEAYMHEFLDRLRQAESAA